MKSLIKYFQKIVY